MSKYKLIISLIILFTSTCSFAGSRLKYDDVYKAVLSGDKDKAYTLLLAYQKQNPDFANTYFQLGIIAKEWAKGFNPYKEFEYTKLFIYNTKLYFNLAKRYIKDEKNKNRSYYKNAPIIPKGKKLQISDINAYIDSQVEDITDYENNVVKIINYYNKSSDYYNECVSIFMKINTTYTKIKNIYLSDEPELLSDMQRLKSDFDSTLVYFQLYKDALKKFPIQNYNQTYKLKDIITYRLDGLTYSDFLQNDILLWNYKKWVQDVYRMKESMVKETRTEIANQDSEIKAKIKAILSGEYSDRYRKFKTDEKFIYKIEKLDNNSLLVKLFKLNEAKYNFLTEFKKEINDPVKITEYPILKRAEFCYNLMNEKKTADSINNIFASAVKPYQIKKYRNFYISEYGGLKGLKEYSFRQELFFDAKLNDAFLNLKKQMFYTSYKINTDSLIYKERIISKKTVNPAEDIPGTDVYRITNFKETKYNNLWFCGYYTSSEGKKSGFTAYSEDKKHVNFIQTSQIDDSVKTYNLVLSPFKDGCWIITTSFGSEINNKLIKYNKTGKIEYSEDLPYHSVPRLMKFDDINNTLLIVFNGKSLDIIPDETEQIIYHYNPDDQLQTYEVKMTAKAEIFDMIRVNNKIFLFSNFINYKDLSGNTIFSKAGSKTNVLISIISKGMIKKQIPIFNSKPFFGVCALKINSNTLNILGYKSELITKDFDTLTIKELFYELIDAQAKEIYSAWHD